MTNDLETAARDFKLPEIYNACAHPQAVWFEEHWRPIFIKMQKRIEELEGELDNKRGAMTLEIHRLMQALTKERQISKMLEEGLNNYVCPKCYGDIGYKECIGYRSCKALTEVQKLRGE